MTTPALAAQHISFSYTSTLTLHDVSLTLHTGELAALVGPNGCGKTTLLRILAGALNPQTGAVTLGGTPLSSLPERRRARRIAVVPQNAGAHFGFSVSEVVWFGRTPYAHLLRPRSSEDRAAVETAMHATGIAPLRDRRFDELSGGEQQRVMVAMALAQETEILLLDEPTVHLDLGHQHALMELLVRLRAERNIGVLAVMHDLNLSSLYFERMLVMQNGRLVADGKPDDLLTAGTATAVFDAPLLTVAHPQTGAAQIVLRRTDSDQV